MMEKYVTPMWTTAASGLGNHLWQSTLVALIAGLLALALRKYSARARYGLWWAASLKFLIPFSLLVELGRRLTWTRHSTQSVSPGFYFAIDQISQPFSQSALGVSSAHTPSIVPTLTPFLPYLTVPWLCGFFAVLLLWTARWHRISCAMRSSVPLRDGREVQALRRVERIGGLRNPIPFRLSHTSLEPGIFGIARPTLIWPDGISRRLDEAQLEAILAHEVWHVRRRDNLSAALHMLVEAVFWFYPLVWWLGARLVEERERACDEEVVALGSDRQVYAESILKVCEFCLGSPLPCISGVTGADLKRRMVHIMNDRILHNLGLARKLLLTVAAALAIALPVTFGLFNATPGNAQGQTETATLSAPAYSSVSIKPSAMVNGDNRFRIMFSLKDGSFVAREVTLQRLIQIAYHVQDSQISGGPDWLNTARFDVDAKLDPSFVAAVHQPISDHKNFDDQAMLKSLLASEFKLATHSEARTVAAYDLVIDENGTKLQASGNETRMMQLGRGELTSSGAPLEILAAQLSSRLGRPVVDKTGLKGSYAFTLHWTPDPSEDERLKQAGEPVAFGQRWSVSPEPPTDSDGPSLMTALQEQLGLKLNPQTEPVQIFVIDHAEQPSEN
jgi:bla regulator protein blaR1